MWAELIRNGGPEGVRPDLLQRLRIFRGGHGIWVDKQRTEYVSNGGVTVSLLHMGARYADDLSDDGVIYHYPKTCKPGKDAAQISATKYALLLGLPVFVVICPRPKSRFRNVRMARVTQYNDTEGLFLAQFGFERPFKHSKPLKWPFELEAPANTTQIRWMAVRSGQAQFRFAVLNLYGAKCAVCNINLQPLLDAAHLREKHDRGSDDPRNGLVLCALHHRAFDAGLWGIEPNTTAIVLAEGAPTREGLGILRDNLHHLSARPHPAALKWRWKRWKGKRVFSA